MDDGLLARECKVKRCYECNRLEEQLWNLAYEQLWPLVRRQLRPPKAAKAGPLASHQPPTESLAKGA